MALGSARDATPLEDILRWRLPAQSRAHGSGGGGARCRAFFFDDLGFGSSQDAEWLALIHALELAQSHSLGTIVLIGDAIQVIRDTNRSLKEDRSAPGHAASVLVLAGKLTNVRICWIRRSQNLAGIALATRHPR